MTKEALEVVPYSSLSQPVRRFQDGTYGLSHEVLDHDKRVVMKVYPIAFFRNRRIENILNQFRKFRELSHPGLVRIKTIARPDATMPSDLAVLSEYCANKSLKDLFQHEDPALQIKWDGTRKTITIYWITLTMAYLHHHKIVHGFLKPSNILFDNNFDAKISEYWVSSLIETDSSVKVLEPNLVPRSAEAFLYKLHGPAVDVFMWGQIVYQILIGRPPFTNAFSGIIEYGERPSLSKSTPSAYVELLVKCLDNDACARPTFSQIAASIITSDSFVVPGTSMDELADYRRKMLSQLRAGSNLVGCSIGYSDAALNDIKKKAENGNVESQVLYADLLEKGDFITKNMREAVKFYEMAAKKDNPTALFRLGLILANGLGVKKDIRSAISYLKRAADSGDVKSQFEYAVLCTNRKEATKYFELACASRDSDILYRYAKILISGTNTQAEGFKVLGQAAENGSTLAQYEYGKMLIEGTKVPQDELSGFRFLRLAAEKGNCDAQLLVAKLFIERSGWDEPGEEEAMRYLGLAAAQHNPDAVLLYAEQTEKGKHLPRDYFVAKSYYKEAAILGSTMGQYKYADLVKDGKGDKCDKEEVMRYFKMAWDKGCLDGMVGYAEMLIDPTYKGHNEREGINLMKKAAQQGFAKAQCQLARLYLRSPTAKRLKEALRYLAMAAEQGYGPAVCDYACFLKDGKILSKNVSEAVRMLKESADKDDPDCCFIYGKMLLEGDSVPADIETGKKYIKAASRMGDPEAERLWSDLCRETREVFDPEGGMATLPFPDPWEKLEHPLLDRWGSLV